MNLNFNVDSDIRKAETLPAIFYKDPELFEIIKKKIFLRTWHWIGDENLILEKPILATILRAGLPLHQGLLNYFDAAQNAFISAYRHHPNKDAESEIVVEYFAAPAIEHKILLLADPMLATGQSLVAVHEAIKKQGIPKEIHIVAVIASQEGIDFIENHFPENTHLWIAAIDPKLNEKGYIIPGLGDAGDLAFGTKL